MPNHLNNQNKIKRLRKQAEELAKHHPGFSNQSNVVDLFHEMEVAYHELEIQAEELKRAQVELASLHQEYENLFEFAPCGYVILDTKGLVTRANLTAIGLLQVERRILLSSAFVQFVSNGYQNAFLTARRKAETTGEKQRLEIPLKQGTQLPLWVELSLQPEWDKTGHLVQLRMVLFDISERKAMDEELEATRDKAEYQSRKYTLALSSMTEGLIFYDNQNMITHMNPAAEAMVGFTLENIRPLSAEERIKLLTVSDAEGKTLAPEKLVSTQAIRGEPVVRKEIQCHQVWRIRAWAGPMQALSGNDGWRDLVLQPGRRGKHLFLYHCLRQAPGGPC